MVSSCRTELALAAERVPLRRTDQLLTASIAAELVERIVSGVYPVGELIPTAARLCIEFEVSRTVVREAVKVVVDKGLLAATRGVGTRVESRTTWRALDPEVLSAELRHDREDRVIRELFVLRVSLEPALAAIAAANSTVNYNRLDFIFSELQRHAGDRSSYATADAAFHKEIVALSDVNIAIEIFQLISKPIDLARQRTIDLPGALGVAHAQHELIYRAIKLGDADAAASAMKEHLSWNQERLGTHQPKPDESRRGDSWAQTDSTLP